MHSSFRRAIGHIVASLFLLLTIPSFAQSSSGAVTGTVVDPAGAVVPKATVTIQNPVSGLIRSTTTDSAGHFQFTNIPFNSYHLTAQATGFAPVAQDASIETTIPVNSQGGAEIGWVCYNSDGRSQ